MREPYLALYVADHALHFEKKLSTEKVPREIIEIPLSQVVSDSLDEAARKLGVTVFGLFKLWHKQEFESWGDTDDSGLAYENFKMALHVIDWLSEGASEERLSLVDEILEDAAKSNAKANEYMLNEWPSIRKRLSRKQ